MSNLDKAVSDLREATIEYETGNKESALYKIAKLANIVVWLAMDFLGFRGEKEGEHENESIKS